MTTYQVFSEQQTAVTPTATDEVPIYDASTKLMAKATVGNLRGGGAVAVTDAATYTVLAANSGMIHMMPNLTADIVITLPTAAAGLDFTFWYTGEAADAQDWQIDTGAAANFYIGNVVWLTHTTGDAVDPVYADGNSNDLLNVITPAGGTWVRVICDGTNWYVNGQVVSATTPTFAD